MIVVVVSSDRPVSVFRRGIEIHGQCGWRAPESCVFKPILLDEWLDESQ